LTIAVDVISGLVSGYLTLSLCESFFHRTIQHADAAQRRLYKKLGPLGQALRDAWYSHHMVHHILTFRANHVTQFAHEDERAMLDAGLKGRRFDDILQSKYGTILGSRPKAYLRFIAPTLPIFSSVCYLGGAWFSIGAIVPLFGWVMLAQCIHPYLHMRRDDVIERGSFAIRALAQTGYFKYLARHHWLHHRYESCNYNLLLGGDHLLGVQRGASAEDLDEMRAIGLF
jgi:hypothetical protein